MGKDFGSSSEKRLSPRALLPILYLLAILVGGPFTSCSADEVPAEAVTVDAGTVRTFVDIEMDGAMKSASWQFILSLDIFVFDDDDLGWIDTYNRIDGPSSYRVAVMSGKGDKRVVAVANTDLSKASHGIGCYDDFLSMEAEYTSETPEYPVMCGECRIKAGEGGALTMKPLLSLIEITGIRSGKELRNLKAYVINAANRCPFIKDGDIHPSEYLNFGSLKEVDLQRMRFPGMIYSYIGNGTEDEEGWDFGAASLYCYPNNTVEESAGSPFTEVVLEGECDGQMLEFHIPVNQIGYGYSGGLKGIVRNTRYMMEVSIGSQTREACTPLYSNMSPDPNKSPQGQVPAAVHCQ